jgi:hypothetical protein
VIANRQSVAPPTLWSQGGPGLAAQAASKQAYIAGGGGYLPVVVTYRRDQVCLSHCPGIVLAFCTVSLDTYFDLHKHRCAILGLNQSI